MMHPVKHESALKHGTGGLPPSNAFRYGPQPYNTGVYYSVMADTRQGLIPGKANWVTGQCLYAYDEEVHSAEGYYWLVNEGLSNKEYRVAISIFL